MFLKAFFFPLMASTIFGGPIMYTVTTISATNAGPIGDIGINNSGQVVGGYAIATGQQAAIRTTSGTTLIPLPTGWTTTFGNALNSSGEVVGYGINPAISPTYYQAFVGTTAGSTAIPLAPGWTGSGATAVNDSGQVVGFVDSTNAFPTTVYQAFIGNASGMSLIPGTIGVGEANSINDLGYVVGFTNSKAWIWDASDGTVFLNSLLLPGSGWNLDDALSITNTGLILASASYQGGPDQFIVYALWTKSVTVIPLPTGATFASPYPYDPINDLGYVVGTSDVGGWIWDASDGTVLLNNLLLPGSGWNVQLALSISNNGLILADASYEGGQGQFVELAAVPEPGTFVLAGASFLLAALARRCRASRLVGSFKEKRKW
jgi:PEP-CTERM motif